MLEGLSLKGKYSLHKNSEDPITGNGVTKESLHWRTGTDLGRKGGWHSTTGRGGQWVLSLEKILGAWHMWGTRIVRTHMTDLLISKSHILYVVRIWSMKTFLYEINGCLLIKILKLIYSLNKALWESICFSWSKCKSMYFGSPDLTSPSDKYFL